MNIQKIKLDLTLSLLNKSFDNDVVNSITAFMADLQEEVGSFIDSQLVQQAGIDDTFERQTYAIQYENCTLNVDVVYNKNSSYQYLRSFNLN